MARCHGSTTGRWDVSPFGRGTLPVCSRYTPPKYSARTAPKTALDTTLPPSTDRFACRNSPHRPSSPSPSPFSHPIDHGQWSVRSLRCGSPHAVRAPVVIHVAFTAETQRRRVVRTTCVSGQRTVVSGQWSADSGQCLGLALWQCGRARPTVGRENNDLGARLSERHAESEPPASVVRAERA